MSDVTTQPDQAIPPNSKPNLIEQMAQWIWQAIPETWLGLIFVFAVMILGNWLYVGWLARMLRLPMGVSFGLLLILFVLPMVVLGKVLLNQGNPHRWLAGVGFVVYWIYASSYLIFRWLWFCLCRC